MTAHSVRNNMAANILHAFDFSVPTFRRMQNQFTGVIHFFEIVLSPCVQWVKSNEMWALQN